MEYNQYHLDLQALIAELGQNGGLMSPSVYDTAQSLRFAPPAEGVNPGIRWLLENQGADGSWCTDSPSYTRVIPTLASLVALTQLRHDPPSRAAALRGVEFLAEEAQTWSQLDVNNLPVGAELIIPALVEEGRSLGLVLPSQFTTVLHPVTNKKLAYIRRKMTASNSSSAFSWEAWGESPSASMLDQFGSVGHNPSATAYWLFLAANRPDLSASTMIGHYYLSCANQATLSNIPGVMPTAWPLNRFEQTFALHSLTMAGLMDHPHFADAINHQTQLVANAMRPDGIGFTDYFMADGDDTAAAASILRASGRSIDQHWLQRFQRESHFQSYVGELQSSHTATSRAIQALDSDGVDVSESLAYIASLQRADGSWAGDKWNTSWLYGTCLAIFALRNAFDEYGEQLVAARDVLCRAQSRDGGWTAGGQEHPFDTAYGALALHLLHPLMPVERDVLVSAHRWLCTNYERRSTTRFETGTSWLNKQTYVPFRIDWTLELAAIVALEPLVAPSASNQRQRVIAN